MVVVLEEIVPFLGVFRGVGVWVWRREVERGLPVVVDG